MSKIFGELLMLIENDYRGMEITLAYDKKPFSVPKNLYIIGMMNTADRSLAMIDYALRRRFSFVEMTPGFNSEGFEAYQSTISNNTFGKLISRIKALNADIENDASLGKGFCIGHSYFCNLNANCSDAVLKEIVEYDIVPMLEEYWFDDEAKAKHYELIQNLAEKFKAEHNTIICRELLGLPERADSPIPSKRTEKYYQERPCEFFIKTASEIIEKEILN